MNNARTCSDCQGPLPQNSPEELCSKCQLQLTVISASSEEAMTVIDPCSPSPHDLEGCSPPIRQPRPGSVFGGYQIVRLLGQGGMGTVYEAEHLENGRRVALKILTQALDTPEARKRFLREGRLAAAVTHPNLVYIFGTEDIEGSPAIAMELVAGGTLTERIQGKGPMAVNEAVDTCLQIIAGLEIAAAAGVLHRDIKPSNCFADSDGVVKVGDFGLSISTMARLEPQLTMSGSFLGTPAYSSPEQLRGDDLDLRSDIYSVGVTLYYLLTGKTPFTADNMVKLMASVLEKAPESPAKLRRDIPWGLDRAVLRCLAKKPAQRFNDYAELRAALQPFASSAQTPASLTLRARAGIIDSLILAAVTVGATTLLFPARFALLGAVFTFAEGRPLWSELLATLFMALLAVLYYSVTEGRFGATPGKASFKLRLAGTDGKPAGLLNASLRSLPFVLIPFLPRLIVLSDANLEMTPGWAVAWAGVASFGLLFATARKRNGFAGLHDLLSRTRVMTPSAPQASRTRMAAENEPPPDGELPAMIGPYHAGVPLDRMREGALVAGYDSQLLRKVWIQKLPPSEPPVSTERQNLSRAGRIRWITGRRSAAENWDAYEAVPGQPLLNSPGVGASWSDVRYWLLDLAEEIQLASKTRTLPSVLDLDRVWIGANGRAKLLDFPAPNSSPGAWNTSPKNVSPTPAGSDPYTVGHVGSASLFLKKVAMTALEGRPPESEAGCARSISVPLPLHARKFLDGLSSASDAEVLLQLGKILSRPAKVTRRTRITMLLVLGLPWLLTLAAMTMPEFSQETVSQMLMRSGVCGVWIFLLVVPSLICALLFRGGCVVHGSRVAFVRADGSPASRLRIFWRMLLTWLPAVLTLLSLDLLHGLAKTIVGLGTNIFRSSQFTSLLHGPGAAIVAIVLSAVCVYAVIRCILSPERSLADRLAGTWMVPR